MDVWNADKLTLFVLFFLPGFISMKVYDLIVAGESRDFSKSIFEAVAYSTLNFGALFWLIVIVQTNDFHHRHFALYSLAVALIMVFAPACWPFLFVRLSTWSFLSRHLVHPIRKPWDYIFRRHNSFWIVIHLRDGSRIGGRFGPRSFASSDPADEQIYLEETWVLDTDGRFLKPIERSRGIVVMKDEMRAVELFE